MAKRIIDERAEVLGLGVKNEFKPAEEKPNAGPKKVTAGVGMIPYDEIVEFVKRSDPQVSNLPAEKLIWIDILHLFESLSHITAGDERSERMRRLRVVKTEYEKVIAYYKTFVLEELNAIHSQK